MSSLSPAKRRADAFAAVVDGGQVGDARFAEFLEVVGALRETPRVQPRADYAASLRSRLMLAADTVLVPTGERLAVKAPTRRRDRRIAITAGAAALLGCTTSVAFAAQSALPGDTLYPIKRILESAEASLASDDTARAEQYLDLASSRLEEAELLAASRDADSLAEIPGTLEAFVAQATTASQGLLDAYEATGDVGRLTQLRDFIASSLDTLAGLKSMLPAEFGDSFDDAVNALLSLDEQALTACPDCGGLLDVPAILLSGAPIANPVTRSPAPTPTTQPPAETVDPVTQLLDQLPDLNAPRTTAPSTEEPEPGTGGEDPLGEVTDGVTQLLPQELTDTLGEVTKPLADLLEPLLGTALGDGGLLGGSGS